MKKIFGAILTIGLLSTASFAKDKSAAAPKVDLKDSKIKWTGYGVGKSHWGHIKIKEADVKVDKKGEPVSAKIVVDMASIETKDLEGEWAEKLNGHLKNKDFFEVSKYPTATFVAEKFTKKGNSYMVAGKMTIKDKTHPQEITMKIDKEKGKVEEVEGKLQIDRAKYNVKYNSKDFFSVAKLGDKLIENKIDLEIELEFDI